jgi:hypothetical protein
VLLLCAWLTTVAAIGPGVPNVPVARGTGQVVFGDLPVVPGSFPDYGAHRFSLSGSPKVKPQAFNYGTTASPWNVLAWYRMRLPRLGWHIDSIRTNYPAPNDAAIVASRRGEGVTIIVEYGGNGGSRVSLVKLNSSR